ncbi:hypothetical protein DRQ09_00910 [candidate division KSB1 bacterium]|nr:MAG: hypothetical protein DRQ09_00910 [candidate division KSB1 bacterium]
MAQINRNLVNVILILIFILQNNANSQTKTGKDDIRIIYARKTDEEIKIDGNLFEKSWEKVSPQADFIQLEPHKGKLATEKTEVKVLYNEENLYIGFKCYTSSPSDIIASITRRDQLLGSGHQSRKSDDNVVIIIDTFNDMRNGYCFAINPLGTQLDMKIANDGRSRDTNWDSGWKAKAQKHKWGWSAEFSIPFKIMRFNISKNMVWGINFGRFISKKLETDWWSGRMDEDFRISQGGILMGLDILKKEKDLHLIPYSTSRQEKITSKNIQGRWKEEIGLDIEYNPISNLTSNFTINPDFASVEGDREQINLTRFELQFPEKRRFFLEGSELFRNRIRVFYSRRIGNILYGGKATGKFKKYNIAMINVQAEKVQDDPYTDNNESFPEANISVFRAQRDILKSSTIGLLAVNKQWKGGYNRVVSLDATLNLPYHLYGTAQFVGSWPGNLTKGSAFFLRLERRSNIYDYHLRYTNLGEEFRERVNPVGFIRDDDRHELDSAVRYKWWIKGKKLDYIDYRSNYNIYWSHKKILRSYDIWERLRFYFVNKLSIETMYDYEFKLFEKRFFNNKKSIKIGYNTEEWTSKEIEFQWGKNFDRDYKLYSASAKFKPSRKLSIEYSLKRLIFNPDPNNNTTFINILICNYQFNPDLFIRLFVQNNSSIDRYYIYSIFGYRFRPPYSAIYVVFTNDRFCSLHKTIETNRILFLKFSYSLDL